LWTIFEYLHFTKSVEVDVGGERRRESEGERRKKARNGERVVVDALVVHHSNSLKQS